MGWLGIVGGVLQILLAVLKNKMEKDVAEKARKDALLNEWKEISASGDISRINAFLVKLRP